MVSKMSLLSLIGLLCCSSLVLGAVRRPVTPNPALKGVSIIEPAPDYNCTSNGAHPHETDCQYFYDCWNGDAHLGVCTELQLFDLRWHGCEEARYVDCGDRFRPTGYPSTVTPPATTPTPDPSAPTTQPTTIPPIDFTCPEPGGAFPHAARCDYYWLCIEGEHTLTRCQLNYLFDLRYSGCNFPEQTECQERERPEGYPSPNTTTTTTTTTTTQAPGTGPTEAPVTGETSPPDNFTCPEPGGAFPHERRCELYWLCQENVPSLEQCQLNYLFDLVYMGCNFPQYTHCQDRERPEGYPAPSTTTTAPQPTDEWGSTIPTTTTTRKPGPGFECPVDDGNYADPENCASFYQCSGGVAYHQNCPDGLHFNPVVGVCDFPGNVDCEDRPIP